MRAPTAPVSRTSIKATGRSAANASTILLSFLIEAAWPMTFCMNRPGTQDHPADAAAAQPFLDRIMAAADDRGRIRADQRLAAADPHQILGAGRERGVEDGVLLDSPSPDCGR